MLRRWADQLVDYALHALSGALAVMVALCLPAAAKAQFERLPPVIAPDSIFSDSAVRPASGVVEPEYVAPPTAAGPAGEYGPIEYATPGYAPSEFYGPAELGDIELAPGEQLIGPPVVDDKPPLPPGAKPGMLQRTTVRATWLAGGGAEGLGMTDVGAHALLAFPIYIAESPLLLSPSFMAHMLDGPTVTDLPPSLYDVALEVRWMKQVTPRFGAELAVAPSLYTDFENNSSEAFRVTGRGVGSWEWTPTAQLIFGVAYLGRDDLPVLPVGGLIWKPDPDTRWEFVIPRPRIARRTSVVGDRERWWYVAGEYGGNTYAIERASGLDDEVTYADYRFLLGVESKALYGLTSRFEAGYIFGRSIDYESGTPGFDPTDTALVRAELSY